MRNIRVINVSNRCRLYFAVGVASLWAIAYATSSAGYPTLLAPQSVVIVLPLLVLCDFYRETPCTLLVGTFMLPLLFFAWSFKLLNGQVKIPMRSKIGTVLLMLLSAIWLVFHSSLGVQYQGTIHTFMVCIFNILIWVTLIVIGIINSMKASYLTNYLFHWLLFAWLGWVAFPWLGELI